MHKSKKKKKKKNVLRLSKLSYCEMSFTFAGLYNAMSSSHQTSKTFGQTCEKNWAFTTGILL